MKLTPEQSAAVSSWIAAGDNLSTVQRKLREQFSLSFTFMDVRFLVDDLNLQLKDPAPKANADDVSKPLPPSGAAAPQRKADAGKSTAVPEDGAPDLGDENDASTPADEAVPGDALLEDEIPAGASNITVEVDKVTLHPGALASGTVTFSDGVTGKWIVDNYGRPGFTEVSQPGYRPKPADAQAFMEQLSLQLQKRGF